jgi:hypothetical protein
MSDDTSALKRDLSKGTVNVCRHVNADPKRDPQLHRERRSNPLGTHLGSLLLGKPLCESVTLVPGSSARNVSSTSVWRPPGSSLSATVQARSLGGSMRENSRVSRNGSRPGGQNTRPRCRRRGTIRGRRRRSTEVDPGREDGVTARIRCREEPWSTVPAAGRRPSHLPR